MASSLTLDISSIGQQISTAITAGMTKMQEEIIKAVAGDKKSKEADLAGLQGLILAMSLSPYKVSVSHC